MDYPMLRRLTELVEAGREAVLCTVVDEQGSTPRGRGAAMLVLPDGSTEGTIGGGVTEHHVIERVLAIVREGLTAELYRESLSAIPENTVPRRWKRARHRYSPHGAAQRS